MGEAKSIEVLPGLSVLVHVDGKIETPSKRGTRKNGRADNRKGRVLKVSIDKYGYEKVTFSHEGRRKTTTVHRLVALAFIPNNENKPTVNHIDGNNRNNNVSNLEWATHSEQKKHAIQEGLCAKNIIALSNANKTRARSVVFEGRAFPSIREASRLLMVDRKRIAKEGVFIDG